MIAWLREELKARRWDRKAQLIRAGHSQDIHKAHTAGDWDKWNELSSLSDFEASEYEDEAAEIRSSRLVRRALRLSLPIPTKHEGSEHWWQSRTLGTWALTDVGFAELRRAVRLEEKERRDVWLALGGMLVSILSLVVAIIALLKP
ncbi:hypothetical protein U8Q06_01925 [Rhizobium beringeri]|uniref:hypothetical protein n=1 Tax=Rhizobium TaxID=379 RepID=UPI0014428F45|nr:MULTISPECIES: hypothetical protein [Rhizobium]NKL61893.1 hypothetical protein [Rhizobium leguminosarum bv. viciae]WSH51449.1 hypothetical protein U8Q06_01925 [Rhizobium beringeri]